MLLILERQMYANLKQGKLTQLTNSYIYNGFVNFMS